MPLYNLAEGLCKEPRHNKGKERIHTQRLKWGKEPLLTLYIYKIDKEGQHYCTPTACIKHIRACPKRLADRIPNSPNNSSRKREQAYSIELCNHIYLGSGVSDNIAQEETHKQCTGSR